MGYSFQGWEHDLDNYLTHDPRDDAQPVKICDSCKEGIYEGETYYKIDGKSYCEHCIDDFSEVAELEDEE